MRRLVAAGALATLVGCAAGAFESASRRDSEAAFRRFLGRTPDGPLAGRARERLEALAFQRARRGDDIPSYNRFLEEFPEGDFADEARELRAWARLRRALAEGGEGPLRRLLETDPGSQAAARGRARLELLVGAEAARSSSAELLRAYLLAFPDAPDRARTERRLDDLTYDRALETRQIAPLRAYLEANPHGVHRAEAEDAIEELAAEAAIASGQREALEAFLVDHPGARQAPAVSRALAALLLERARLRLDGELAAEAIALAPGDPLATEAETFLSTLRRGGPRTARVARLVGTLVGPLEVRGPNELRVALGSDDPLDGWNAVREAALSREPEALDLLVETAGSGCPLVVFYSRTALASWADRAGARGSERIAVWVDRLRPRSSNPEDMLRMGVLFEATGESGAALAAYRAASTERETALSATAQRALLAASDGSTAELDLAGARLIDLFRGRLDELLRLVPDRLESDRLGEALRVLRNIEALERVAATVSRNLEGRASEGETSSADWPRDLRRVTDAAGSAGRRLAARLRLEDPDLVREGGDSLSGLAAEHVRARVAAAEELGRLRATAAVPALAEIAAEGSSPVSRAALAALAAVGDETSRMALLELVASGGGGAELASALRAAAARAPAASRPALVAAAGAAEQRREARRPDGSREGDVP